MWQVAWLILWTTSCVAQQRALHVSFDDVRIHESGAISGSIRCTYGSRDVPAYLRPFCPKHVRVEGSRYSGGIASVEVDGYDRVFMLLPCQQDPISAVLGDGEAGHWVRVLGFVERKPASDAALPRVRVKLDLGVRSASHSHWSRLAWINIPHAMSGWKDQVSGSFSLRPALSLPGWGTLCTLFDLGSSSILTGYHRTNVISNGFRTEAHEHWVSVQASIDALPTEYHGLPLQAARSAGSRAARRALPSTNSGGLRVDFNTGAHAVREPSQKVKSESPWRVFCDSNRDYNALVLIYERAVLRHSENPYLHLLQIAARAAESLACGREPDWPTLGFHGLPIPLLSDDMLWAVETSFARWLIRANANSAIRLLLVSRLYSIRHSWGSERIW